MAGVSFYYLLYAYLYRMRFFLSIILLFVFFFAPFNSKAGAVSNERAAKLSSNKTPAKAVILYLISDDHVAVTGSIEHRNNSVNRSRLFSHADFFSNDGLISKPVYAIVTKYFVTPHLYCETIGSKLLFPKHYFW